MTINRRTIVTGAAALSLAPAAASTAPALSPAFALALNAFNAALAAYTDAEATFEKIHTALGPDAFKPWRPTSSRHRRVFYVPEAGRLLSVQHAESVFAGLIQNNRSVIERFGAKPGSNLYRGHMRAIEEIEECRRDALAYLTAQEERNRSSGLDAAGHALDEAADRAGEAFRTFLALPCNTLDEVRAKAAAILRSRFADTLDPQEVGMLLRSLAGAADQS